MFAFGTVNEVFARTEELTAMGLSVPQVTKIFTELKRRGFDVADNIFTVEQAKSELLRLLGKAGGNNA